MEEARIKMVGDESWAKENVVTGILRLVRENGVFSTFGGLPAMLSKQVSDTHVILNLIIQKIRTNIASCVILKPSMESLVPILLPMMI